MKKVSRHDGPFGRNACFCCCYPNGNSRRERKWRKRVAYEPNSRSIRGNAGFWSMRGYLMLRCLELGFEAPSPRKAKRRSVEVGS